MTDLTTNGRDMATVIEFGRKPDESDEDWAAACKAFARAYAKATGMEHLLPDEDIAQ